MSSNIVSCNYQDNTESTQSNRSLEEFFTPHQSHTQEWLDSGVDPAIINLNIESIAGSEVFERLYPTLDLSARRNDGRLRDGWLRKHDEVAGTSGWWVSGTDPQTWQRMEWGRYKPTDGEILDSEKKKPAKYLSPAKTESRLILLEVSGEVWQRVSERCGISIEKCDRDRGFWHWVWRCNVPIELCEGEKKAGSLLTQGYAAIALPGIYSGYRSPKDTNGQRCGERFLIPDLAIFDTSKRRITICFDFESDPKKAERVRQAAILTGTCFKKADVRVASLPGPHKGVDDFIVAGCDYGTVYQQSQKLSILRAQGSWRLTYPVNLRLNQRYLGELPFPESGLAVIKSPKGTGKTTALQKLVSRAVGAGRKTLLLTHRIVLGQSICNAVGIPYISEVIATEQGRVAGFGLCIDSCHPQGQGQINPENWAGAIVIIDEVEQVLWHLLNSSTCYEKRVAILKTFKHLVAIVLSTGGLLIAQDADVSNLSVEFLQSCAGFNIQPWVVVNDWKPALGWDVTFYEGQEGKRDEPAAVLDEAVAEMKLGGRCWIQTDSQKAKSTWGTKNIEQYLRQKLGPYTKILRIDSETVSNPNHPAFNCAGNLNEVVSRFDVVIASPTLATGVSVDIKGHFTRVLGIFQGSTPANEALQSLSRVREPVPRSVWARVKAIGTVGNGSESHVQLTESRQKDVKLNCRLLKDADFDLEKAHDAIALRTWAKMGARINASAWDFRWAVWQGLKAEGHTIRSSTGSSSGTSEEIKAVKVQAWDEEAQAVAAAQVISEEEYAALQEKRSRTEEERLTERKYQLTKRYGVEVCPEVHKLDQSRWHPQIQLHYYLSHNPEYVRLRDRKHLAGHVERGEGKVCAQDIRLLTLQVELYRRLGLLELAQSGRQLTSDSPEVQAVIGELTRHQKDIKDVLGLTVTAERAEAQPMRIVQDLLGKLGISLIRKQRRGDNGEREWFYEGWQYKSKLEREVPHLRETVFTGWEQRDQQALEWVQIDAEATGAKVELAGKCYTPETVSSDTKLSPHTPIRRKQTPVTPQEDQPEAAPFKQGALVRWAGKAAQFAVTWCGCGIAAVRDLTTGTAFNAPTDELALA